MTTFADANSLQHVKKRRKMEGKFALAESSVSMREVEAVEETQSLMPASSHTPQRSWDDLTSKEHRQKCCFLCLPAALVKSPNLLGNTVSRSKEEWQNVSRVAWMEHVVYALYVWLTAPILLQHIQQRSAGWPSASGKLADHKLPKQALWSNNYCVLPAVLVSVLVQSLDVPLYNLMIISSILQKQVLLPFL